MVTIKCGKTTFPEIEAILFDKDGTLCDSRSFLTQVAISRAELIDAKVPGIKGMLLKAFGFIDDELQPSGLMATGTRYETETAAAAFITCRGYGWTDALAIARCAFEDAEFSLSPKAERTPLFPGVMELISTFRGHCLKLGLLSADSSKNVDQFVQVYSLGDYFQFVMGIDHPPSKPDPSLIQVALNRLNVSAAQLLVIGDAQTDIQLAHAGKTAGCIAAAWGSKCNHHLHDADAIAYQIEDIQLIQSSSRNHH